MRRSGWFSLVQFFLLIALCLIGAMLYWSSLLVEQDLKQVKREIQVLKQTRGAPQQIVNHKAISQKRVHIDPSLPNLLTEDPFYAKVLPGLLPEGFVAQGTMRTATVGVPQNLHPFSPFADVNAYLSRCGLSVSKNHFGVYETYAPYAAIKMEKRDVKGEEAVEYWIHLREGMFWQPLNPAWFSDRIELAPWFFEKHPVTAYDFKLYFDLLMNPYVTESAALTARQYFDDVQEFRVIDELTFVVKWKKHKMDDGVYKAKYKAYSYSAGFSPIAAFVYQYYPDGTKIIQDESKDAYRTNSTFAQVFQEHWAKNVIPSCGPYIFQGMTEQGIRFDRNPDHFYPLDVLVEGLQTEFKIAQENIWQNFKLGSLDSYALPPTQVQDWEQFRGSPAYQEQVKAGNAIKELSYPGRSFSYIGWNLKRPLFANAKVRQAMTYAIDRPRIIREIMSGQGNELSSPFSYYSNAYDKELKPYPFDPAKAKAILAEEGFADFDGDGYLEKKTDQGLLKASFYLTYYVKNVITKAIVESVATSLKEIGVQCILKGVDIADISAAMDDKDFDAYFLAWVLSEPPEDITQIWHSSGANVKGSSNTIGYSNPVVDQIAVNLTYEDDPQKREKLYKEFDRILYEEQPYTLMYSPINTLLYREKLQNVFLPVDRKDLIPNANISEPIPDGFWLKE